MCHFFSVIGDEAQQMARALGLRRRRRGTQLLDLPPEILETILKEVGETSLVGLYRAKLVCTTLRDRAETPEFFRCVDLWKMDTPNAYEDGIVKIKERCLVEGNNSALFLRGVAIFFRRGQLGGLSDFRRAAEGGYDLARYVYANLFKILNPNVDVEDRLVNLDRDFVRAAQSKVRSCGELAWNNRLPLIYIERVAQIDVVGIYQSRCVRNRSWPRPWDERVKKGIMCDFCF